MRSWRGRLGVLSVTVGACAAVATCSRFDTTRTPPSMPAGTVGEEAFRVLCERVDVSESPGDYDFAHARPYCTGQASGAPDGGVAEVGPKVTALAARRMDIAGAIDRTVPHELYDPTSALLQDLLPLYGPDNGRFVDGGAVLLADGGVAPAEELLPQTTRAFATLLGTMATDDEITGAFAAISHHQGMRPPTVALGLSRSLLAYPSVGDVLDTTLALFRPAGVATAAGPGYPEFAQTMDVMRGELGAASAASSSDQLHGTSLDAALDLLLRTDPLLGTSRPRLLVRRDRHGMPRVALDRSGHVPSPFADSDMDGVADSAGGQFTDSRHSPIAAPTPFPAVDTVAATRDAQGRAVGADNTTPVYQYLDLDQTVLAALMRDAHALVDPTTNAALGLANGAGVLLGSRTAATHDYMLQGPCPTASDPHAQCTVPPVAYTQFDASTSAPLIDLAHAAGLALTGANIDSILATTQALVGSQESVLARATSAMIAIKTDADRHPEATMPETSNVWDDMNDVLVQIAQEPGLLEDILTAAADPHTASLAHTFGLFSTMRDRVEPTWTAASQNASLASRTLTMPVDRTRPDTVDIAGGPTDNRSVMQRFLHLLYDLNGVELCNREGAKLYLNSVLQYPIGSGYHRCALMQIPDAAVFYLKSIDGSARIQMMDGTLPAWLAANFPGGVDAMLQSQSGITGLTSAPTPQALDRMVFQPDSLRTQFMQHLQDPAVTRDGLDVRTVHPGTLFATELYNFYADARPLVHAFVSHGDAGAHLFVQLMSALHLHYASQQAGGYQSTSPSMPMYSTMDGLVHYEPVMADALNGDLPAAAVQLSAALPTITAATGVTGRTAIANAVRMLFDPHALTNIAYRDGRTSTTRSDGHTVVASPNLYYLLADAFNGMNTQFAAHAPEAASWADARSHTVDTFLSVDGAGTATARFHDRAFPVVGRLAVQWIRDRLTAHHALGDGDAWARGMGQRMAQTTQGPAFSASFALMLDLYNDAPSRQAAGGLLSYLTDDSTGAADNAFGTTLTAAADTLQFVDDDADIDPLLHGLAPAFQRAQDTSDGRHITDQAIPITLRFLDRSRAYDTDRTLDRVLANIVSRPAGAPDGFVEPLPLFGDAIAETHRAQPGVRGPLAPNDVRDVFQQVADFFNDQSRGLEQFYYIVQHRRL